MHPVLREAITEIAYRVVSEVGANHRITDPRSIAAIAEALVTKIEEQVTFQGTPVS